MDNEKNGIPCNADTTCCGREEEHDSVDEHNPYMETGYIVLPCTGECSDVYYKVRTDQEYYEWVLEQVKRGRVSFVTPDELEDMDDLVGLCEYSVDFNVCGLSLDNLEPKTSEGEDEQEFTNHFTDTPVYFDGKLIEVCEITLKGSGEQSDSDEDPLVEEYEKQLNVEEQVDNQEDPRITSLRDKVADELTDIYMECFCLDYDKREEYFAEHADPLLEEYQEQVRQIEAENQIKADKQASNNQEAQLTPDPNDYSYWCNFGHFPGNESTLGEEKKITSTDYVLANYIPDGKVNLKGYLKNDQCVSLVRVDDMIMMSSNKSLIGLTFYDTDPDKENHDLSYYSTVYIEGLKQKIEKDQKVIDEQMEEIKKLNQRIYEYNNKYSAACQKVKNLTDLSLNFSQENFDLKQQLFKKGNGVDYD